MTLFHLGVPPCKREYNCGILLVSSQYECCARAILCSKLLRKVPGPRHHRSDPSRKQQHSILARPPSSPATSLRYHSSHTPTLHTHNPRCLSSSVAALSSRPSRRSQQQKLRSTWSLTCIAGTLLRNSRTIQRVPHIHPLCNCLGCICSALHHLRPPIAQQRQSAELIHHVAVSSSPALRNASTHRTAKPI
jgi:hypothetical protein